MTLAGRIHTNGPGPESWQTDMFLNRLSATGRTYNGKVLVAEGRAAYVPGDTVWLQTASDDRQMWRPTQDDLVIEVGSEVLFRLNDTFTNPHWRDSMQPFASVRWMDWTKTNGSKVRTVADLTPPDVQYLEERPGPIEWAVQACNETGKSGYFCIPHMADDDCIRHLVREGKKCVAGRRWEYSNEPWNTSFPQFRWFHENEMGRSRWDRLDNLSRALSSYLDHAEHAMQIVHEEDPEADKCLGGWANSPWWNEELLRVADLSLFDYLVTAPYFEGQDEYGEPNMWLADMGVARCIAKAEQNAAVCAKYGVRHGYYEANSNVFPRTVQQMEDAAFVARFRDFHLQPDMNDLFKHFLTGILDHGEWAYVYRHCEQNNKHTTFGVLEKLDVPTPRYEAILELTATAQTADMNRDGVVDQGDIQQFLAWFFAADRRADINKDGVLDHGDIDALVAAFKKETGQ